MLAVSAAAVVSALAQQQQQSTSRDAHPDRPARLVFKGERHTGTNFLSELLADNFVPMLDGEGEPTWPDTPGCGNDYSTAAKCYNVGDLFTGCDVAANNASNLCCWKHGYTSDQCTYGPKPRAHVILTRNPYSWLYAMYEWPYDTETLYSLCGDTEEKQRACWPPLSFSDFLKSEIASNPNQQGLRDVHPNPVALWQARAESYLRLTAPKVLLRHEELYDAARIDEKLAPLITGLGFSRTPNQTSFAYPAFSDHDDKFGGSFTKEAFDAARAYELEQRWLPYYSQDDLDFVNSILTDETVSGLGYERRGGSSTSNRSLEVMGDVTSSSSSVKVAHSKHKAVNKDSVTYVGATPWTSLLEPGLGATGVDSTATAARSRSHFFDDNVDWATALSRHRAPRAVSR